MVCPGGRRRKTARTSARCAAGITNPIAVKILKRRRAELRRAANVLKELSSSELNAVPSGSNTRDESVAIDNSQPIDDVGGDSVCTRAVRRVWERLQPHEHQLAYISDDRREGHFMVAAHKIERYHKSFRQFVTVGFRFIRCAQGAKVLVGWCSEERECSEPPGPRELFPEMDFPGISPDELQQSGTMCPCASSLLEHLGGEGALQDILELRRATAQPPDVALDPTATQEECCTLIGHWALAGKAYVYLNPCHPSAAVFGQWGVLRSFRDGYACQVCSGTPRHCQHTSAMVEAEELHNNPHMSREEWERRVTKAINPITGKLWISSISQQQLPFFPEEDETVHAQIQGECQSSYVKYGV